MPDINSLVARLRNRKGFTLIELLVVISIIAILVTVIVATFGTTQEKARDNRRKTDLDALKKALELHKSDTTGSAFYPNCTTPVNGPCTINAAGNFNPAIDVIYLRDFPTEPTGNHYHYAPANCANATECTDYTLLACLENANDSDANPGGIPGSGFGSACSSYGGIYAAVYSFQNP